MPTKNDVITRALRRLRIVAMDESATADQEAVCSETLDALAAEYELPSVDFVDDYYFLPLANLLSVDVAAEFSVQAPEARGRAMVRLGAVMNPDDREIVDAEYF